MLTKTIIASIAIVIMLEARCQNSQINTSDRQIQTFQLEDVGMGSNVIGMPYGNEKFRQARVIGIMGDSVVYDKTLSCRYHAVADKMEVETGGSNRVLNTDATSYSVSFVDGGDRYETIELEDSRGFALQIAGSEQVTLFLRQTKKFIPEVPAQSGYQESQPAKYVDNKPVYFLLSKSNNELLELPRISYNRAKMLKKKQVSEFITKNDLDPDQVLSLLEEIEEESI